MDSQMTVGKKLTLIGALLIGLTMVLGVGTLIGLKGYDRVVTSLSDDALAGVSACASVEARYLELRGIAWRHVAATDPGDINNMDQQIQGLKGEIAAGMKDIQATIYSDEEREINRKIDPALARFYEVWDQASALGRAQKNQDAYQLMANNTATIVAAKDAIRAETEYKRSLGAKYTAQAAATGARMKWLIGLLLLLSTGLGSGVLFLFVRSLTRLLRQAVTELMEGAGQVASASAQVASSSQALAQGSSEQAASLEETAASGEQITSMTQKNAENSSTAAALMSDVDKRVIEGNQTLEQMVESMHEITGSSDKISKIIKVIDEIAFHAAVEAARAGEAGMGFAVVADEVRSLAQRSAQAAKDTSALIEESIAKSNEGGARLQRVAEVIRAITESTVKVKTLVDEVNLGSQEQARGIQQISKAIAQMDQVTQGTAASAEQGASASEQLSAQAEAMQHAIRKLSGIVNSDVSITQTTAPKPKRTPAPAKTATSHAGSGLRALKSAASHPAPFKPVSHPLVAAGETPSDAQFLESFKEM
jgi:methyl-accepting chemotaxis protein/methyl-accepting chemotaxis protein-1 (serine sensor receptor)